MDDSSWFERYIYLKKYIDQMESMPAEVLPVIEIPEDEVKPEDIFIPQDDLLQTQVRYFIETNLKFTPTTRVRHKEELDRFTQTFSPERRVLGMSTITKFDVRNHLDFIFTGHSHFAVNRALLSIRCFIRWGKRSGLLAIEPEEIQWP